VNGNAVDQSVRISAGRDPIAPLSTSAMLGVDSMLFTRMRAASASAVSSSSTGTAAAYDGSGVDARLDEMHAAAGESHAVVERLLLDVQGRKDGSNERMFRMRPA